MSYFVYNYTANLDYIIMKTNYIKKEVFSLAIVTTIRKVTPQLEAQAKQFADMLHTKYVLRENLGLNKLKDKYNDDTILVVKNDKLILDLPEGEMFFHPNMAQIRIKRLRYGGKDNMLEAMQIQKGMKILDCTLGFAADAIVSGYGVGEGGTVVGLEINPLIALIVREGLKTYLPTNYDLKYAMDNIQVVNQDYLTYLKQQPDNAFDIVYFDPMFRHPLTDSKNLNPLRQLADKDPLSLEALNEAKRVAKYRIVFKENSRSLEFARLGFTKICGGKYAPIHYGVLEL